MSGWLKIIVLVLVASFSLGCGDKSVTGKIKPLGLRVFSAEDGVVSLEWNAVADADGYTVYWSDVQGEAPNSPSQQASLETETDILGLDILKRYYFVYTFTRAGETSDFSDEVTATLVETVTSRTGKIWLDRNLGALQVCASVTDVECYGDYYQWGRGPDGHQKISSPSTSELAVSSTPEHGDFIISISDWLAAVDNSLWQSRFGRNNPCPSGYRLPLNAEWVEERNSWDDNTNTANALDAFDSILKLPMAGKRYEGSGLLENNGSEGNYWTSGALFSGRSQSILSDVTRFAFGDSNRAAGYSVRCIEN